MFLWSYVTFPRPIVCVDFIFEVSSVVPPLPTEKKNFRWQRTWKSVFQEYLNIASTHEFSDCRFGIYAKSWVYTKFFTIMALFWWKFSADPVFAPKNRILLFVNSKIGFAINRPQIRKIQDRKHIPSKRNLVFFWNDVRHTLRRTNRQIFFVRAFGARGIWKPHHFRVYLAEIRRIYRQIFFARGIENRIIVGSTWQKFVAQIAKFSSLAPSNSALAEFKTRIIFGSIWQKFVA